jgi:hypothetical protein
MSQAYSGVGGNVFTGAVDLDAKGWNIDYTVNVFDSTTTADGGWDDETAATQRIEGTVDVFYNILKKPTGATAGLTPGSTPTMKLYVNLAANEFFTGKALIKKLSLKSVVKEGFTVTVSFVNKAAWTVPS